MPSSFHIKIPATTANLGPGFDTLSLALALYMRVDVRRTKSSPQLILQGHGAESLPTDNRNLIWQAIHRVTGEEGCHLPNVLIKVKSDIPIARGLGSSAAAIIAGILIAERSCELNFSSEKMLSYALELEGHPDNVAAALIGGFVASCVSDDHRVLYVKNRLPPAIKAVVVVPDFELSTVKAREVLPNLFTRKAAVFNLQRTALLVSALQRGKLEILSEAMRDLLHQPYRGALIPGLEEILAMQGTPGLLGVALSGAGPSVLALATAHFKEIGRSIQAHFDQHGIASRTLVLKVDNSGTEIKNR